MGIKNISKNNILNKVFKLEPEILNHVEKQIKLQQKGIKFFPILFAFVLFLAYARNNGRMPEYYFYLLGIPFYILTLYSPLVKGVFLGRLFYIVEIVDKNTLHFTTFGSLWRKEKKIVANQNNIKTNKTPLPKLLYNKYLLNEIFIEGKKYFIFNKLLEESGV